MVGVLAVPGRDHGIIDRDVHEREVARCDRPADAVPGMFGDRYLAPAIGRRPGVPVGHPVERCAVAPGRHLAQLAQLLLGRSPIGRWRDAQLPAGDNDPGIPAAGLRLARERGARYALKGMVLRAGERLRALVCFLDVASACQLWGDCYHGSAGDPFPLQDRVIAGIMRAVLPNVRGAEIERARRKPPEDLSAYDLTMRAFPLAFAASPGAAQQALDLLARAMEINPADALPVALAAWCHAQLVTYNGTRALADEKACALRLAQRANVLDANDDPLVITARCAVHTMLNDLETGASLLERALALDRTSPWAWG